MKFQILFLSLLTTTHARYEPKGLRLRDRDDVQLYNDNGWDADAAAVSVSRRHRHHHQTPSPPFGFTSTEVPRGRSADVDCGSMGSCCWKGDFSNVINVGTMAFSDHCPQAMMTKGSLDKCNDDKVCTLTCNANCKVQVRAGRRRRPPTPSLPPGITSTKVPWGMSADVDCTNGGGMFACCVQGEFSNVINVGAMAISGNCPKAMTKGSLDYCQEDKDCTVNCNGDCKVQVQAGPRHHRRRRPSPPPAPSAPECEFDIQTKGDCEDYCRLHSPRSYHSVWKPSPRGSTCTCNYGRNFQDKKTCTRRAYSHDEEDSLVTTM